MDFSLSDQQAALRDTEGRFARTEPLPLATEPKAARLSIWRAAANPDQDLPSILDSSSAKCFANRIARSVTGHAVQLMARDSFPTQYPMKRRMRDAWGWGIAGGAIDIQKVTIAGAMISRRFDQRR